MTTRAPRPQIPCPSDRPPEGDGWLHEIAFDGVRLLARARDGRVRLFDAHGEDRTRAFAPIARAALEVTGGRDTVIDGVACVLAADGTTRPPRSDGRDADDVVLFAFDLPREGGESLARAPLEERKRRLERLLRGAPPPMRYADHVVGSGDVFYRRGCELAVRGIVSKRRDAPYRAGRHATWRLTECARAAPTRPLRGSAPGAAQIANAPGGRRGAGAVAEVAGVRLTHAERVLFPSTGTTKEGLARFYASIADWIVPHVRGRPLTLVRCPRGGEAPCAYMRHAKVWGPRALRRVDIQEKTKVGEYLVADDLAGVVALVQMDVIEIHTWNATAERLEQPDRFVIDLDPDPGVRWPAVIDAAHDVRARLEAIGLESWVKTTGGKGLHVVAPIAPTRGWDEVLAFTRAFAAAMVRDRPDAYTLEMSKARRAGRIFLDYLRNNRGNTSIAAYSTRARAGAPISVPIRWDELTASLRPASFTIDTVPARLASLRRDPWEGYFRCRQRLGAAALRAVAERRAPTARRGACAAAPGTG